MKKIILTTIVMLFALLQTKAQQEKQFAVPNYVTALNSKVLPWENTNSENLYNTATNGQDKDHDFYLRRSKNYRIAGWSTLGAGILLSGIGLLTANGDYATNNANSNTAATLTIAGAVSGVVSIPFMIMASAYKHKARVMVGNQKTGFGVPSNVSKDITGLTMTIPIGK